MTVFKNRETDEWILADKCYIYRDKSRRWLLFIVAMCLLEGEILLTLGVD